VSAVAGGAEAAAAAAAAAAAVWGAGQAQSSSRALTKADLQIEGEIGLEDGGSDWQVFLGASPVVCEQHFGLPASRLPGSSGCCSTILIV